MEGIGTVKDLGGGRTAVGLAEGGDFVVPPGYPNDSFPIRVSSGERVTVQTEEQQAMGAGAGGTPGIQVTNIFEAGAIVASPGMDEEALVEAINARLGEKLTEAQNAGYAYRE